MKKPKREIETFLGLETSLEGKLAFEGTVRIDGHFTGSTESKEGVMVVGEKAVIDADILVHTAVVYGEVHGNIRATKRIELHQPARVFGDLSSPVVIIDAGVVFHGNCSMEPSVDANSKTINVVEWQA
jgi:cytoskeletal protein CcmA (bactofilin family)